MNKEELVSFLVTNQKGFVFFFSVLFGVVAQECYQLMKHRATTFKKVLPKAIVAFFVCFLAGGFFAEADIFKNYYPHAMMLLAFLHRPIADWIMKDFLPYISKSILNQKKGESNNGE